MPVRRRIPPPTAETTHLPAPMGGLNTVSAGSAMPLTDCLQGTNVIASELGLRSRLGYREWVTNLNETVYSLLPFTGAALNGANDRLFATTQSGIWEVSGATTTPTQVVTFENQAIGAGFGISHTVVTAGGHFLAYCDEINGLFVYQETSASWTQPTQGPGPGQIDNVDPGRLVFVTVFKNRVWFVERATARAWYLPAGAIYGAATAFDVGQRFKAGGSLVGLWNWTYDGGSGLDDSLVAVSTGGDVCIYKGTDPSNASTFGLSGVWGLGGAPPSGRTIATDHGGELLLLSRIGVLPLSRLVAGEVSHDSYVTAKVSNLFNSVMLTRAGLPGWSIRIHPEDNALLVTMPTFPSQPTDQLVCALAGRAWFRYRDLPINCCEEWGGKLYFGTTDGRVCVNDGYVDGVLLSDPNAYTPVECSVLTAFTNLGNGRQKQVQMLRPTLLSDSATPAYAIQAHYHYDTTELAPVAPSPGAEGTWDFATWDETTWGGDYNSVQRVTGATGVGVDVAVAIRFTAVARTTWVGTDIVYTQGGWL